MKTGETTVKNLVGEFHEKLAGEYPPGEISQMLYMLFREYLGWTRAEVHLSYGEIMPREAFARFDDTLAALVKGKPVQYILGKTWFDGLQLHVNEQVLIPRPETEELVSLAAASLPGLHSGAPSILDIGTGSGCIAIALKNRLPMAKVTAVDSSAGALEVAGWNARENGLELDFRLADMLSPDFNTAQGLYHLMISNPPYVTGKDRLLMKRNVVDHEPATALFVPDDDPLLFYRAIASFGITHLETNGLLFLEINELYGTGVCELVRQAGFMQVELLQDIHGRDRFVKAISGSPSARHR